MHLLCPQVAAGLLTAPPCLAWSEPASCAALTAANCRPSLPLTWIFIGGMAMLSLIIVAVYGWLEFGWR
jgi:hypothetical protein